MTTAVRPSVTSASVAGPVPRLSTSIKVFYGLGGIADAVKTIVFGLFILYFYTSVMGLPGTWVGIAAAIGLVWDAVIDPYIGYLSDRSRFRFGRRHTFMLVGSLTMGLSFFLFFSPPQGLSNQALFAWLLATSFLVRAAVSCYVVPYLALGAELSQDYHERTSIAGIRGLLALLGTMVAASLLFVVFFPNTQPGVDPKLNYASYPLMGLTLGAAMTIVGLVTTLGTLSHRPHLPGAEARTEFALPHSFFTSLLQSLRNPSFRSVFLCISLFFLGVVINSSLSIHYLTYYVQITESTSLSLFQFSFYAAALVGVAFWIRVSRIVEKHVLCFTSLVTTATLMVGAFVLLGEGNLFGTQAVRVLIIGHALAGFFASVLWFMPASMIADVADEDYMTSGHRREGSFFGIYSFGQTIASALSILLTGLLIDHFAGLVPGQAEQSSQTIWRIGLLYGVLPATLLSIAALLLLKYRLNRRRVEKIRSILDQRP